MKLKNPCLLALGAVVAAAQSAPDILDRLVANSPFLPGPAGAASVGGPTSFEFRGVVADSQGLVFSVYDQGQKLAEWVRLDEPGHAFVARTYDEPGEKLTIEHQGRQLTLPLKQVRVQALAQAQPPAPSPLPAAANRAAPNGQQAAPAAATRDSQEAERLKQLADEIRRRRALREAQPGQQQPQPPRR